MTLDSLLKDIQVLAILCNQYGDTGKGKFSDYFAAQWAHIIARGTGGANAGHTVVINGVEYIFHLIPAGILYDADGKINILGNGMVIDPDALAIEFDMLDKEGISYKNLKISEDANVTLPFHVWKDVQKNKSQANGGIGSTGRGIGPTYEDKIARRGITIGDLFDSNLAKKIDKLREENKNYDDWQGSTEEVVRALRIHTDRIGPYVDNTVALLHSELARGKRVALEGAQGLLLSIEHGMRKYSTSSDCSLDGTASGVGLSAKAVDLTLGILKFPFMTRVGGGPFITELGREHSERYCAETEPDGKPTHSKKAELTEYGIPFEEVDGKIRYDHSHPRIVALMNSKDVFLNGVGTRLAADEYGATTARPRRIGWTDAVAARYAVRINGPQKLILTKADALAGTNEFRICHTYETPKGPSVEWSRDPAAHVVAHPLYKRYDGYGTIEGVTDEKDLPGSLREAVSDLEKWTGASVAIISTGRDQQHNVIR